MTFENHLCRFFKLAAIVLSLQEQIHVDAVFILIGFQLREVRIWRTVDCELESVWKEVFIYFKLTLVRS